MRRVYYRFPNRCDLDFVIEEPFITVIERIGSFDGTHITKRVGDELIKLDLRVFVAKERTEFERIENIRDFYDNTTEIADFRIVFNETILTGERRIPRSATSFLVKVEEKGMACDCFIAKEGSSGNVDALDLKNLILGR
jgi:hypothetical protein